MTTNGNTKDTTSFLRQAGICKFWTATVKGIPAWRRNDAHRGASKGYVSILLTIKMLYYLELNLIYYQLIFDNRVEVKNNRRPLGNCY